MAVDRPVWRALSTIRRGAASDSSSAWNGCGTKRPTPLLGVTITACWLTQSSALGGTTASGAVSSRATRRRCSHSAPASGIAASTAALYLDTLGSGRDLTRALDQPVGVGARLSCDALGRALDLYLDALSATPVVAATTFEPRQRGVPI